MLAIAGDVAFLMNRMSVCSYGMGAIIARDAGAESFLEEEDFPFVLSKWAGVDGTSNAAAAKAAADLAAKVGNKKVASYLAKTMCAQAGILVGKKIGSKVAVKLGAKFGGKLGAKLAGGWVPFVGAAVSGGVNYWFISGIGDAAEEWYRFKASRA